MPNSYVKTGLISTLPRHPYHLNHNWPSYGGTIAAVRHLPQMTMVGCSQNPPPPSTIAMQHLATNNHPRVYMGPQEEDISAETPLMVKRESTV